jgi:UDP-2-acetamido-3-amino-2,3-dideoxy-glucuronate N-acetyltransferase
MTNLALIGGGYWGKNLARNFLRLGSLHTICDANQQTLDSYDAAYAAVNKVRSFDTVIADKNIDKVVIATPAATHYHLAKRAIEAGKHVYVEKPLCLSISEGRELIEFAQDQQRILMVGHLLQYHPCVVRLREMVKAGELGKLFYITSNRLNLGKIRSEENALWSFAPHDISVILGLAGQQPISVQCNGEHYLTQGVADTTLTQMAFPGGLRAHVFVSWLNPFKEQKLTVVGSNGMAVFDDTKPWQEKLVVYRDYLAWESGQVPVAKKLIAVSMEITEQEPLLNECQHFLECCGTGNKPLTDGREGLAVLEVLDAAQRSLENQGLSIQLDKKVESKLFFSHPTAIVDEGAVIGAGSNIWHFSHVSSKSRLGENCNLGQNVFIAAGVSIGNNVKIQNNVSVYAGTEIHDDVFLGPSCVLTNVSNPRSQVNRKSIYEQTVICRGATIGANSTIVCGTTLGRYSFVAAGAVVSADVPDYGLVMGVPAQQKGWMSRHGHRLEFEKDAQATCPESGFVYQLEKIAGKPAVRCLTVSEDEPLPKSASVGTNAYGEFKSKVH